MNSNLVKDFLEQLQLEYESCNRVANIYLNKWIDNGLEKDRETELLYRGSSFEAMRIKEIFISLM